VPVAIVLALFVAWAAVFIRRTTVETYDHARVFCLFDDAMVSMRYAWNLAHGDGLVWNPGERVEGYSNLLQTLLMAALIGLFGKVNGVLAVQVIGIAVMATFGVFALRFAERMSEERGLSVSPFWRGLYLATALAYYPLAYWTLSGMETGLVAVGIIAAAWYALASPKDRLSWPLVLASGIATLARPDALIPVVVIFVFRLFSSPRHRRGVLVEAMLVAAVVATAAVFRFLYYGEWVPNTYTLKIVGYPLAFRLAEGRRFITPFLGTAAVPLAIAVVGLVLRPGRWTGLPVALFGAAVGYQVWVGGDAWDYWRFLAGTVPVLVLAAVVEARLFVATGRPFSLRQDAVVLAVLAVMVWRLNARFAPEMLFDALPYEVEANGRAVNTGLALKAATSEAATIGVFRAGAIVYFAERRGVDFLGKSDRHIARLRPDLSGIEGRYGMRSVPGHNKYDLDYSILRLRPTYVERWQWGSQDVTAEVEALYVKTLYKGVRLHLLQGSPDVRWNDLDAR
jgi:hypothetical protein